MVLMSALSTSEYEAKVEEAYELHLAGHSYTQIAKVQGCAVSTASSRVQEALGREPQENIEVERRIAHERQRTLWLASVKAVDGAATGRERDKALNTSQKILTEWRKLRGLDAPSRMQVEHTDSDDDGYDSAKRQLDEYLASKKVTDQNPEWERS